MATGTQAKQGAQQQQKQAPAVKGVAELITANIGVINRIIPKHLNADRMIHLAIQLSRKPELANCTPASFVGVFMESAKLGLELDSRGLAYAVPFNNRKANPPRKEAQFLVGYKGLIKLATNSGKVRNIFAHEVYQGDTFDFGYGMEPYLHHKPCGKRDKCTHVYAVAHFKDGGHHFEVMTLEEVKEIRDHFSKAKDSGPWVDNFREMALKTVCRRLCKFLPASPELAQAVALDEAAEAGIPQDFSILPDLNTMEAEYTTEPDDPAMEQVKDAIKAGNGTPPKQEKKSAKDERIATAPVQDLPPEDAPAADPPVGQAAEEPADQELPGDEEIAYHEYVNRMRKANSKGEVGQIYNEAADAGKLSLDFMAKLQGDVKERIKSFK